MYKGYHRISKFENTKKKSDTNFNTEYILDIWDITRLH